MSPLRSDVAVIANPVSGSGRGMRLLPKLVHALAQRGAHAHVRITTSSADLDDSVRAAIERQPDAVVVVGGDGSIHGALQPLVGTGIPLGVLPVGSGDDNARSLGIPRRDPEAVAGLVASSEGRRIDVGRVVTADGREEYFLGVLSAGFDSEVNERANNLQRLRGQARYLAAIVAELRSFRPVPFTVTVDGRSESASTMLVAVGNGISYGGGMRVCPGADHADGQLDVTWLVEVSRLRFIRSFPQVFTGSHVRQPFVRTRRGQRIDLDAPAQTVYADGERIGPLPATVTCIPGALTVLAPPPGGPA